MARVPEVTELPGQSKAGYKVVKYVGPTQRDRGLLEGYRYKLTSKGWARLSSGKFISARRYHARKAIESYTKQWESQKGKIEARLVQRKKALARIPTSVKLKRAQLMRGQRGYIPTRLRRPWLMKTKRAYSSARQTELANIAKLRKAEAALQERKPSRLQITRRGSLKWRK